MENVPGWAQVILLVSAIATAAGVIWAKALHPVVRGAATAEVMFPLLQELTVKFRDIPAVFDILREIVAQVRTDSGSSLLDTVNKLETTLAMVQETIEKMEVRALAAAQFLQVGLDADRKLDERDREQMSRLIREQDRMMDRMLVFETRAATIADNLTSAQAAVDGVAVDLADSHRRANAAEGDPGTAADAASQTPEDP